MKSVTTRALAPAGEGAPPRGFELLARACDAVFLLDAELRVRWANLRAQAVAGACLACAPLKQTSKAVMSDWFMKHHVGGGASDSRGVPRGGTDNGM